MGAFDYLSVLISIVLGFGITQLLGGFARCLELRPKVRPHMPAVAWAAFLLIAHVQTWWSMFAMRHWTDWNFLQFCIVLMQPIILYLASVLVLPSRESGALDLREHFMTHRVLFFGLLIALLAVSIVKDLVRTGRLPTPLNLGFHAVLGLIGVAAIASRRDLHQRILAVVGLVFMGVYVLVLFAELA